MRSILNAVGLTIWGLITVSLAALFLFVGYQAAVRHRLAGAQSGPIPPAAAGSEFASAAMRPEDVLPRASLLTAVPGSTRNLMVDAMHDKNYAAAIVYGRQLVDGNSAGPGDLSILAQSYSSVGDCDNAHVWAQKTLEAIHAAGMAPDGSLRGVIACCGPGLKNYELAIASIERGLRKGGVVHLEQAYVYLGLAKQAVGDIDGARNAFGKLKDVPGISPRVLRLWTLYAETQLAKSENWQCPAARRSGLDSIPTGR